MAKLSLDGLEAVEQALLRQEENAIRAVPKMLEAGAQVVKAALEREAAKLNASGRSTGALKRSIKVSKLKKQGLEYYMDVAPSGKDSGGVRNAEKGFVLNYGRSNMPARPWFTSAIASSEQAAAEAMLKAWEEAHNGR